MVTRREFTESIDKKDGPRSQPKFNEDTSKNVTAGHPIEDRVFVVKGTISPDAKIDVEKEEITLTVKVEAEEVPESIPEVKEDIQVEETAEEDRSKEETQGEKAEGTGSTESDTDLDSDIDEAEKPVEKSIDEQIADLEAQKAELEKE